MFFHTDTGMQVVGLERYESDLREARVRLMLEQAGVSRLGIGARLELWIGDRMIAIGQYLRRRHQADGASIASPLTVVRKMG